MSYKDKQQEENQKMKEELRERRKRIEKMIKDWKAKYNHNEL
jgi:hypothetical protein